MVKAMISILSAVVVLVMAGQVLAQEHFNDGQAHIIDYEIDDDVHIDDGDDYAEMQTTVNIVEGGHIPKGDWRSYNYLRAYNQSMVNISGGEVGYLRGYGSSTVDISGGSVGRLRAYDSSTVDISGGKVRVLFARNLRKDSDDRVIITGGTVLGLVAGVNVTGNEHFSFSGSISDLAGYGVQAAKGRVFGVSLRRLESSDSSTVNIYDGSVRWLYAQNLRKDSDDRVNITGGSVGTLEASIDIIGNEHFSLTSDFNPSDLENYGVYAVDGAVRSFDYNFVTRDGSTVDISGGSAYIGALDESKVDISGGEVSKLWAYNSSTVDISGGSVAIEARDESKVDISGGEFSWLSARGRSTVTLYGYDFEALDGLELVEADATDGVGQYEVVGTGTLSGKWFGESESWAIKITENDETATIMAIPEQLP